MIYRSFPIFPQDFLQFHFGFRQMNSKRNAVPIGKAPALPQKIGGTGINGMRE
jgi:hypothetical protein